MSVDNRWMGYQHGQGQQGQHMYNPPLNPMMGKFQSPPPPPNPMQMGQQTYKNPMMGSRMPPPMPQNNQYYDQRYPGNYQK